MQSLLYIIHVILKWQRQLYVCVRGLLVYKALFLYEKCGFIKEKCAPQAKFFEICVYYVEKLTFFTQIVNPPLSGGTPPP